MLEGARRWRWSSLQLRELQTGQPLLAARDSVYTRTKATYVLWMLRMMVGDAALGDALRSYDPAQDTSPEYFQNLVERAVTKHPPASTAKPGGNEDMGDPANLGWFFKDWVYQDPGLPELSIANVFLSKAGAGNQWLVAVQIRNSGYAAVEIPVTVRSASNETPVLLKVPSRGELSRRILVLGEPTEVEVNDGSVPEVGASVHRRVLIKPCIKPSVSLPSASAGATDGSSLRPVETFATEISLST